MQIILQEHKNISNYPVPYKCHCIAIVSLLFFLGSSASRTYNLKSSDICDVCGTECVFCKTVDSWDDNEEFNSATSPGLSLFWFCSVLLLVIF